MTPKQHQFSREIVLGKSQADGGPQYAPDERQQKGLYIFYSPLIVPLSDPALSWLDLFVPHHLKLLKKF